MTYKEKFSYIIRDLSIDIDELPSLVSKLSGLVYAAGIIEILPLKAITESNTWFKL